MTKSKYYDAVREKYNLSETRRNIILIGTPNHGNLGDHAIAYATLKLLAELFLDEVIAEINMHDFAFDIDAVFHIVKPEDILILQGGGNLGNLYMDDEMIRRYVAARFTGNKIIMFPQSAYFTEDSDGMEELAVSSRIYGANKNLYLIARDHRTEEFLKKNFNNPIFRLPDVVMTLSDYHGSGERQGILLCMRNDREKVLGNTALKDMINALEKKDLKITQTDTVIEYNPDQFDREEELTLKWEEMSSAEFIITDRLHGLIFSVLTGTPCIAFPDLTKKIPGILQDLKGQGNIILADSIDDLDEAFKKLKKETNFCQRDSIYKKYSLVLGEILEQEVKRSEENTVSISSAEIFALAGYWNWQYYDAEYWRKNISMSYVNAEKSNTEKNSEIQKLQEQYNQRLKELEDYKNWIHNLELQIEQLKNDYAKAINDNKEKTEETEKLTKQYWQRIKELEDYKDWVHNLEVQVKQLKENCTQV